MITHTRHQPDDGAEGQYAGGTVPFPSQDEVLVIRLRSGFVVVTSVVVFAEVARPVPFVIDKYALPATIGFPTIAGLLSVN